MDSEATSRTRINIDEFVRDEISSVGSAREIKSAKNWQSWPGDLEVSPARRSCEQFRSWLNQSLCIEVAV